ncbi:hypothetical protein H6P81_016747 [Aristolochia fimbriata]|uniref:Myeloid leukemia factor n=1 Tax=Aristolochia fimbriata TaxID=158543 RepID=A0AAV7ED02_ARIFI|nr:hypothetical protein H6P81_016747 [Aristolochia fimbriata]
MQGGRGGRDAFFDFGDPFPGFGGPRNMMSNIFGGRDPFDDPFFAQPFGGMFGSSTFGPSMFGPSMLGPSMFGPRMLGPGLFGDEGSFFGESGPSGGFIEHQPPPRNSNSRGPIIEEISSDDEGGKEDSEKKDNPRKHSRPSQGPLVEDPDDQIEAEKKSRHSELRHAYNRREGGQSQPRSYSFQSSTVTYGGANGAYYTNSTMRRMGGDGVVMEENKEADTTTGKAAHRISRGIHEKGHSVTRKLNSDGKVDTMQTLHNLNEDELDGFEKTWRGNAQRHLPGWDQGIDMNRNTNVGAGSSSRQNGGWALPSTARTSNAGDRVRIPVEDGLGGARGAPQGQGRR